MCTESKFLRLCMHFMTVYQATSSLQRHKKEVRVIHNLCFLISICMHTATGFVTQHYNNLNNYSKNVNIIVVSMCIFIFLAPTGRPTSVTNGTITSNSITVKWEEVACLDRNGEITGYTARAMTSGRIEGTAAVNGSEMKATITGLTPSTQYIVQVAAVNSAGSGPFSPIDVYSTKGKTNI